MKGVIDSTLREGEQTVGVSFNPGKKLEIVTLLDKVGLEEIEVGLVSRYDHGVADLIAEARSMSVKARLALWCRCNKDDIVHAASSGPDVLSLSIPVSDLHIEKKLAKSRRWVLDLVRESIGYAKSISLPFISLGLEDATRAEPGFVEQVVRSAEQSGADRVRLADTVGVACPAEVIKLVKRIRKISTIEIGVHMHNDFGMATANSVAAIDAGADWVDGTLLGLGERAGNARTEEIAGYLSLQRRHNYHLATISLLSKMVAEAIGVAIESRRPIIGRDIFSCETGLHLQGLENDTRTYEPYPPEEVGLKRRLLYGAKVGKREIANSLKALEIHPESEYDTINSRIREMVMASGRPMPAEEFSEMLRSLCN